MILKTRLLTEAKNIIGTVMSHQRSSYESKSSPLTSNIELAVPDKKNICNPTAQYPSFVRGKNAIFTVLSVRF